MSPLDGVKSEAEYYADDDEYADRPRGARLVNEVMAEQAIETILWNRRRVELREQSLENLKREVDSAEAWLTGLLHEYAKANPPTRGKLVKLASGNLSTRTVAGGPRVDDEAACIEWCERNLPEAISRQVVRKLDVMRVRLELDRLYGAELAAAFERVEAVNANEAFALANPGPEGDATRLQRSFRCREVRSQATEGSVAMVAQVKEPTALVKVEPTSLARPGLLRPIASPVELIEAVKETQALLRDALIEGIDYGVIPGTGGDKGRKVLFKPGAEKISVGFGCHPEYEIVEQEIAHDRVFRFKSPWVEAQKPKSRDVEAQMKADNKGRNRKVDGEWQWQEPGDGEEVTTGLYRFVFRCRMRRFNGDIVGEGIGSCSSLESKYRSRPHEVENTILKMAQKRARIAATLDAFSLSDAFTQDLEDQVEEPKKPAEKAGDTIDMPSDPRDAEKKPEPGAAEKLKQAAAEAHAQIEARKKEAQQKSMTWIIAHCDRVDVLSKLPAEPTDDDRKGAFEALTMFLDEERKGQEDLHAIAPKLALAVSAYDNMAGAGVGGFEIKLDDNERAALKWLGEARARAAAPAAA